MTNNDFPRLLTLLRKEKGYSQKKVAADLGISQALLSHYEKGIRECGLDFLLRVADYYGVSCDYLLGRTAHRGAPPASPPGDASARGGNSAGETQRRLLIGSLHIVFGILKKINSDGLTRQVFSYISCAVYRMFRLLYSAQGKNPQEAFALDRRLCDAQIRAQMNLSEARAQLLLDGGEVEDCPGVPREQLPALSPHKLQAEYPLYAQSLFQVVRCVEKTISDKEK